MFIEKAVEQDLQEILDLQYLAYQSEAKLFRRIGNSVPIRQNPPGDAHLAEKKLIASQYCSGAKESQATLYSNPDIPPLKQTLPEVREEYQRGVILKALDEEKHIIGSVRGYLDNKTVYIGKLMVHPKLQGQGIGTKLLLAIEQEFPGQRYELFTSTKSEKNIRLYEKLGYRRFQEKQVTQELKFVYLEKSDTTVS